MSLSASVLVESIHVQAASGGGVREGTVRALLILQTEAHGRQDVLRLTPKLNQQLWPSPMLSLCFEYLLR